MIIWTVEPQLMKQNFGEKKFYRKTNIVNISTRKDIFHGQTIKKAFKNTALKKIKPILKGR